MFVFARDPYPPNQIYYVRMYNNKYFTGHPTMFCYRAYYNDKELGWGFKRKG